jgi:hypothetical protein
MWLIAAAIGCATALSDLIGLVVDWMLEKDANEVAGCLT